MLKYNEDIIKHFSLARVCSTEQQQQQQIYFKKKAAEK